MSLQSPEQKSKIIRKENYAFLVVVVLWCSEAITDCADNRAHPELHQTTKTCSCHAFYSFPQCYTFTTFVRPLGHIISLPHCAFRLSGLPLLSHHLTGSLLFCYPQEPVKLHIETKEKISTMLT